MSNYAFLSIEKVKTFSSLQNKKQHNYRQAEVLNADPVKKQLNKEIIKLKYDDYEQAFKDLISKSPFHQHQKPKKNAVKALEVLMTYSSSHEDPNFDVERWEKESIDWVRKQFGKDNVVSAVVHYDETVPHIHAIVIPIYEKGLSAYHFIGNRQKMIALQDSYGEKMMPLGLERGLRGSKAKHEDIKKFYAALNKEIVKELPEMKKNEPVHEYKERINSEYRKAVLQNFNYREQLKQEKTRTDSISLQERLEFNKQSAEVEKYRELERDYPHIPIEETIKAMGNSKEYVLDNPEERENVLNVFQTINAMHEWLDKKEKVKEKKKETHLEKDEAKDRID